MKRNRLIQSFIMLSLAGLLIGCSEDDKNKEQVREEQAVTSSSTIPANSSTSVTKASKPKAFTDYDTYLAYIKQVPNFEVYYRSIFHLDQLADGKANIPTDKLLNIYKKLLTDYDYHVIKAFPLVKYGTYNNELKFVEGYSEALTEEQRTNLANVAVTDWNGNETFATSLKAIQIGETDHDTFKSYVESGRYFKKGEYKLADKAAYIPVVLGSEYKAIYQIGDVFQLELITELMNFKVVGFYKEQTVVAMGVGGIEPLNLDTMITMPYFIPTYEAKTEGEKYQQGLLISELTAGYMKLNMDASDLSDDVYDTFVREFEQLVEQYLPKNVYTIPYWPVTIEWP
jgi:hypothetical protein